MMGQVAGANKTVMESVWPDAAEIAALLSQRPMGGTITAEQLYIETRI